jgi:hypothetical protein
MNLIDSFQNLLYRTGLFRNNTYGGSYYINKNSPILIDTANLELVFEACPHLKFTILEKAKMFSNMQIKLVSIKDEEQEIENHPILTLLRKPNVMQSTEAFLRQYSILRDIYANNFIYKLAPTSTSDPKALFNLPSGQMEVVPTGKLYKQTKVEDIISKYKMWFNGEEITYDTRDVIYTTDNSMVLIGESKFKTLQLPISNIVGALKTRNVIIHDRGAMGILSSESKDAAGGMPMNPQERQRIEKEYREKYGIGSDPTGQEKMRVLIANTKVTWEPMSFPTKELMLFEEIEDDFATILGAYGMDRDIFPSIKGATFENKKQGLVSTYQNTIQPEADTLMGDLSSAFKLEEQGLKLTADYSWLPIMQEDGEKQAKQRKTNAEAASIMLRDGVIDHEGYAKLVGVKFTGDKKMVQQAQQAQQSNNNQ